MKKVSVVLIAALLASSTGLMLAVHLHHEDCDHDTHHCDLCMALIWASPAVVEQPRSTIIWPVVVRPIFIVFESVPHDRIVHGIFSSRAPPLG